MIRTPDGEVAVETPSESDVELLRAIDIRHRQHDDFELRLDGVIPNLVRHDPPNTLQMNR